MSAVDPVTDPARANPHQRAWVDLRLWRLSLGLLLAPIAPVGLGTLLLQVLDLGTVVGGFMVVSGSVLAASEVWSLIVGTLCLLIFVRRRGVIRRADCFLLGAFLAFTLSLAAYNLGTIIDWATGAPAPEIPDEHMTPFESTVFAVFAGLLLIPFGTFGGWVFWRVGVRPARPKVSDVTAVFD